MPQIGHLSLGQTSFTKEEKDGRITMKGGQGRD